MNNKKQDTERDLVPAGEGATASDEELAALHRDLDRQLVRKKLALQNKAPVSYAETAETNGQEGARWFVAHDVPKPTEHQTIPDGRVIVSTTPAPDPTSPPVQETTDPMPPPSSGMVAVAPNVTQPMRDSARSMPPQRIERVNRANENTVPDEVVASPLRFTGKWLMAIALGVVVATAILFLIITVWPTVSRDTAPTLPFSAPAITVREPAGVQNVQRVMPRHEESGPASAAGSSATSVVPSVSSAVPPEPVRSASPPTPVTTSPLVVPTPRPQPSAAPPAQTQRPAPKPAASSPAAPATNLKPPSSKHGGMIDEEK